MAARVSLSSSEGFQGRFGTEQKGGSVSGLKPGGLGVVAVLMLAVVLAESVGPAGANDPQGRRLEQ